jgi:hypothetical protein
MLDLAIFISSCGPNVKKPEYWKNLFETVNSLCLHVGEINYKFYIVVDHEPLEQFAKALFAHKKFSGFINQDALLEVVLSKESWAKNYNDFFEKYKDKTKYILISHDDILVETKNFVTKTIEMIQDKKEPIGWITFTNTRYYHLNKILGTGAQAITNSVKNPFLKDRHNHPRLYECHKFTRRQIYNDDELKLLDLPSQPVKVFGPYTHLNLISAAAAKNIGPPCDWSEYTIFLDDDWNMSALMKGYNNVWIPSIAYLHPNPRYTHLRKPGTDLRYLDQAAAKFEEKWGFSPDGELEDEMIESLKEKYKDTHVISVMDKNSYDWNYLK